jgi:cell volume regulation protein A
VELAHHLILLGAFLLLLSIFVGLVSSRIGAPLLLAFLALGMFFGEDGPGGIYFDNYFAAYVIGSMALAIILFDGGLRTDWANFRIAAGPALLLASVGVAVTAALTGVAAHGLLGLDWIESFLLGAVVASTDAAAVFFLLHLHGLDIKPRVRSVLEVESGLNDPIAVFLTVGCVALLQADGAEPAWSLAPDFVNQIAGGAAIGLAAGFTLVWLINRLELASGLYPILAMAWALFTYGSAQALGASGFLAVYLAGLIVGNRRHRAAQLINRFHDGLAWLAQMVMFVMLGLLVTPSHLLPTLIPSVLIAAFLVMIGRPVAVMLCLLPFRFAWNEQAFIAWVGLRGAVAIFLGSIPVLAGIEHASIYFQVAFAVVLVSLLVQGWTIAHAARLFEVELPPMPRTAPRIDVDLPASERDLLIYSVGPGSRIARRGIRRLLQLDNTSLVGAVRNGRLLRPRELDRLDPGDSVLVIAPSGQATILDELFAGRPSEDGATTFGEFTFDGELPLGKLAEFYDLRVAEAERPVPLADIVRAHLGRTPLLGDRIRLGNVELIVRGVRSDRVGEVGIELDPRPRARPSTAQWRAWLKRTLARLRRGLGREARREAGLSELGAAEERTPPE